MSDRFAAFSARRSPSLIALAIGAVVILAVNESPLRVLVTLIDGAFGSPERIAGTLLQIDADPRSAASPPASRCAAACSISALRASSSSAASRRPGSASPSRCRRCCTCCSVLALPRCRRPALDRDPGLLPRPLQDQRGRLDHPRQLCRGPADLLSDHQHLQAAGRPAGHAADPRERLSAANSSRSRG